MEPLFDASTSQFSDNTVVVNQEQCLKSMEKGNGIRERDDAAYETKYQLLCEYYNHIYLMNNRLRHRIYHVKKEINHLKQLKRVLCERLLFHRIPIIDTNLEIPDTDSVNPMERIMGEVAGTTNQQPQLNGNTSGKKRKRGAENEGKKEAKGAKKGKTKDKVKRSVISIIESIVDETHREKHLHNSFTSMPNYSLSQDLQSGQSSYQHCASSNSNYEPLSESDLSSEELADRLIHRRSSIDHLLPEYPSSENEDKMTGADVFDGQQIIDSGQIIMQHHDAAEWHAHY